MTGFEILPKKIEYQGDIYFLHLGITAWDKYNLYYQNIERNKILSIVVEGPKQVYRHPYEDVKDILDAYDLEDAVRLMDKWIAMTEEIKVL